jgi:putative salt-induced outer membrane protein YdiY
MRSTILVGSLPLILSSAICAADPPKPDGEWRGSFGAGLSAATGNTDSTSFNINGDAVRATPIDEWDFGTTALYGTKTSDGESSETANLARAFGKYDRNINDQIFGFGSLDFEHDKLQELDLRSVFALGLGYHLIKTDSTIFDVSSGVTYNHETYTDLVRSSEEIVVAEETSHKLSDTTSIKQRFAIYPNLTESGQYRAQFDASLVTSLSEHLSLQMSVSDRYQSNPLPDIKKNDLLFLTSVNFKFGPK